MKQILLILLVFLGLNSFSQSLGIISSSQNNVSTTAWNGLGLLPNLIAVYEFDEVSGTTVNDAYGTNHGTNTGAAINQTGIINKAYSLISAESDYVTVPSTNLSFTETDAFSISVWVKFTSFGGWLFSKMDGSNGWPYFVGYGLWTESSGAITFALIGNNGGSVAASIVGTNSILIIGNWYHIVATHDGSHIASGMKVYLNGTLLTLNTIRNDFTAGSITNAKSVQIGTFSDNTNGFLDGTIDQIAIWGSALTQTQVTNLNGTGSGVAY